MPGTSYMSEYKVREEMCEVGRRIYNKGFAAANDGNISMRLSEDRVLCTPTRMSKGFLKPDDLCIVDMTGKQVAGKNKRSSEILLHLTIMKTRPEVKSCVHCHPPHATAFAIAREPIPKCAMPEFEVFLGEVAIAPYETPGTQAFADTVIPYVKDTDTILLANHGTITVGGDLMDAYFKTEIIDAYCRILMLARQLGRVHHYSDEKAAELIRLKPGLGVRDVRLEKGLENCDLCGNSLFREGYTDFQPEPCAFVPPKLLGLKEGAGADRCGCATTAQNASAPSDNMENLVQRITDEVMRALPESRLMNVGIIGGGGLVGSCAGFALQCGGIVRGLDLIDVNADLCRGQALDLLHGAALRADQRIRGVGYEAVPELDLICITAGLRRKPDESRLDLINRNVALFLTILDQVRKAGPKKDVIILVVSNPVDVLTYLAVQRLGLPAAQVIGLGTMLDSARFRSLIAEALGLPPTQVTATILGEHGESMVPIWSAAQCAGMPLEKFPGWDHARADALFATTRGSGAEVIKLKGGAGFAVGVSIAEVIHAIAQDARRILPVSSLAKGAYGIRDVCLSLPTVLDRRGVSAQLEIDLWPREVAALQKSGQVLRSTIDQVLAPVLKPRRACRPANPA